MPEGAPVDRRSVELLHRNALRLLKLVNTLLDFSRIEAGRVEAVYEPTDLVCAHRRSGEQLSRGDRTRRAGARRRRARPCPSRSTSIATCGRRSSSTCSRTRSSSPSKASITVRSQLDDDGAWPRGRGHRHGHRRARAAAALRALSPHRGRAARAATRAPASGSRSSRSWCACTAATFGVTSRSERARRSACASRAASRTCPPPRIRAARTLAVDAPRARRPSSTRRSRWGTPLRTRRRSGRAPSPDDRARRAHRLRRRQRRHARLRARACCGERWAVEAVGDGQAALESIRRAPPDLVLCDVMMPGLDGFGLVRGDARRRRPCAGFPSSSCRRAPAKRTQREGLSTGRQRLHREALLGARAARARRLELWPRRARRARWRPSRSGSGPTSIAISCRRRSRWPSSRAPTT